MEDIPKSRRIGKTTYRFRRRTEKKGVGTKEVRRIRKSGSKARLVKVVAYDVYSAPKAKRKVSPKKSKKRS